MGNHATYLLKRTYHIVDVLASVGAAVVVVGGRRSFPSQDVAEGQVVNLTAGGPDGAVGTAAAA